MMLSSGTTGAVGSIFISRHLPSLLCLWGFRDGEKFDDD
jgi:hypothetical protein